MAFGHEVAQLSVIGPRCFVLCLTQSCVLDDDSGVTVGVALVGVAAAMVSATGYVLVTERHHRHRVGPSTGRRLRRSVDVVGIR